MKASSEPVSALSLVGEGRAPSVGGPRTDPHDRTEVERLLRDRGLDVQFDEGHRGAYSMDASNYRRTPLGVVRPRNADDVVDALAVCRAHGVPVVSRGGGTGLGGQTVNFAVVLDFSRHMNRVLSLDPERRLARVQPGTILDRLREQAEQHGLWFGPDPATHDRCTLGGMIGNDSCGVHSVQAEFHGPGPRTCHQVESLDIVTYDGLRMTVGATSDEEYEEIVREGGRRAEIYAHLRALVNRYAPLIRERYPDIPRRVSGYDLVQLLPEAGFHVARALVGSESTCVTVVEATVRLIPRLPHRTLVVLGYEDIGHAGRHIPRVREARPVACEGVDHQLVEDLSKKGLKEDDTRALPEGNAWLLVELAGDSDEDAVAEAHRFADAIRRENEAPAVRVVEDPDHASRVWEMRESALGATAFVPGMHDTWPGWEDSAVPVDRVGDYLFALRALYRKYDLRGALYGHLGQGCIHTRIDFDLKSESGLATYQAFTAEAADLVVSFGGSLSGEHGDGQSRSDLLVKMYGPEIIEAFREFKSIWDPDGKMNPERIVDPASRTEDNRVYQLRRAKTDTSDTWFSYPEDGGSFAHATLRCVGVGKCRRTSGGTMCPSYMVTREETQTTRGRARLLYEMILGETVHGGWGSEAVKDALDLCLACKGCKHDCPVDVDMATYKAEFLAHYYDKKLFRPRHAYAFGYIYKWARLASFMPRIANFFTQTRGVSSIAKWLAGATPDRRIPRFATRSFRRQFRRRAPSARTGREVVLWADTFNEHFFPDTLMAAVRVLESAGYDVLVPRRPLCCGRPLYDYGFLDDAVKLWHDTMEALEPVIARGTPIVVLEPSCAAAFRDELPNLFPKNERARRLTERTFSLAELLTDDASGFEVPRIAGHAIVHGHCQHKAILGMDSERELLERTGLDFTVLDSGCCGLAGSFGFERGHYDVSIAAGERVLLPAVRSASSASYIVADGFSCREQIKHATDRKPLHLAELLEKNLEATQHERGGATWRSDESTGPSPRDTSRLPAPDRAQR